MKAIILIAVAILAIGIVVPYLGKLAVSFWFAALVGGAVSIEET